MIRVSGPDSLKILTGAALPGARGFSGFRPRFMHHAWVVDGAGEKIDECMAVYLPGPGTFTGEDCAEIHCHGSPLTVQLTLERCLELGARQAEPGEFSKRAFLNGRMDLSQAEAVAELVAAPGREALRVSLDRLSGGMAQRAASLKERLNDLSALACLALDFPDDEAPPLGLEDFTRRLDFILADLDELLKNAARAAKFEKGRRVLLLGPANAGKSSLLNAFCGKKRALVSDRPGTTRDFIEADLDFGGLPISLVDTAGIRGNCDPLESLGVEQSLMLIEEADLIWITLDGSGAFSGLDSLLEKTAGRPRIITLNKSDLPQAERPAAVADLPACPVSALTGAGLDRLAAMSREALLGGLGGESRGLAPNARQAGELKKARDELAGLKGDLEAGQSLDASLSRLDAASAMLDAIIGLAGHDELLDQIFSQFCIGK